MKDMPIVSEEGVQKATLSTVVIFEDAATRERATLVCDNLVKQFWPDIRFKFDWWRVSFLEDEGFGAMAAQQATRADFVIFSGSPDKELSLAVKRWFESWSKRRDGRDGAFVDLTDARKSTNGAAELKKIYLRDIAARALMDYVTKPPVAIQTSIRNRQPSCPARLIHAPSPFQAATERYIESSLIESND